MPADKIMTVEEYSRIEHQTPYLCYNKFIMMQEFYSNSHWGMGPLWFMGIGIVGMTFIAVLAIISIALKGYSLWHASKRNEKGWFIAMLILNTVGILELIYIIFILKKWSKKEEKKHEHNHHKDSHDDHHEHKSHQ